MGGPFFHSNFSFACKARDLAQCGAYKGFGILLIESHNFVKQGNYPFVNDIDLVDDI